MAFSFWHKPTKELVLVFIISSDVVEGILMSVVDTTTSVLFTKREDIPLRRNASADHLTKVMLDSLHSVAFSMVSYGHTEAKKKLHKKFVISTVHYCISSPWVASQSKTVETNYSVPTQITQKEIQAILTKEKATLNHPDTVFFEQKVIETSCNGYAVNNPDGIRATKLQVTYIMSMASSMFLKKIRLAVGHVLHSKKDYIHASLPLVFAGLTASHQVPSEYLLLNIHGELTDIAVIKRGICAETASFPFGSNTFTRKFARSLGVPIDVAHSTLRMYHDKKLDSIEYTRIDKHIAKLISGWNAMRLKTIEAIGKETAVPQTTCIVSNEDGVMLGTSIQEGHCIKIATPVSTLVITTINKLIHG